MKKQDILKRVGNPDQLISISESVMSDGKAKGSRIIAVETGKFSIILLPDRGFDVASVRYMGTNVSFMSKNGIVGAEFAHTNAVSFVSCFTGGFLYTCGLDNIGDPTDSNVLHGNQSVVPATRISIDKYWNGDDYCAKICGYLENTALFGQNIVIKRTFTFKYNSDEFGIVDEIENKGFVDSGYMMLYHYNLGYPMVDDGAKVVIDAESTVSRTQEAEKEKQSMLEFSEPVDVIPEYVYIHKLKGDNPTAQLVNEKLGLQLSLTYNKKNLPYFCQWKSLSSGDYVLGLEPASCPLNAKEKTVLKPFEKAVNGFVIKVERICSNI